MIPNPRQWTLLLPTQRARVPMMPFWSHGNNWRYPHYKLGQHVYCKLYYGTGLLSEQDFWRLCWAATQPDGFHLDVDNAAICDI